MLRISASVADLVGAAADAPTAAEVGRCFFTALQPFGARALHARAILSALPDDEHSYSRISPPLWEQIYKDGRFGEVNYLVREVRRRAEPFRWSSIGLHSNRERELAQVLVDLNVPDGIGAPVHGPRYLGVTSIAFERLNELAPEERSAIGMAATVLHQRMRQMTPSEQVQMPRLSPRERDCLALIAEGRTDWEISEVMGVAETTVMTHVQNARRKLGARSRAQAVALCLLAGIF